MRSASVADWFLSSLAGFLTYVSTAEETAVSPGILQRIDARVKVLATLAIVFAVVFSSQLSLIGLVLLIAIVLAGLSRVTIRMMVRLIWLPVVFFTGLIAFPALFTTSGTRIVELPAWGLGISSEGLHTASLLLLRAETAATLSALLAMTTRWPLLLRALRALHMPMVFVVILSTTYRYLFLLLQTASEMADSRRSRSVGRLEAGEHRRIASATIGVLLNKSFQLSDEVHMAMLSRGFRGEFPTLQESRLALSDYYWLAASLSLTVFIVMWGR